MSAKSKATTKAPPKVPNAASLAATKAEEELEAAERFEAEITWCINLLKNGFRPKSKKIDPMAALRTLESSTTSKVVQRTMMRAVFGDYRSEMIRQKAPLRLPLGKRAVPFEVKPVTEESDKTKFFKHSISKTQAHSSGTPSEQPVAQASTTTEAAASTAASANPTFTTISKLSDQFSKTSEKSAFSFDFD